MRKLDLKAYAKINLTLDVTGTRPDGYHEISTVMQFIGLYDNVCVKWTEGKTAGIEIETASNRRYLPTDKRNIAYKAAELMAERYEILKKFGPGKVRIDIKKQIPVAAGLGGGSADGAAVLHALSDIWGLSLSLEELCRLGAEIGSDVPFCVMGQAGIMCALAEGTGTELTPVSRGIESFIVLSKPPVSVSTAAVYKGFDQIEDTDFERPDTKALIAALAKNDLTAAGQNMINVLENYTLKAYPLVEQTKEVMISETQPVKALMSGSGPTIIGFYEDKEKAEAAREKMAALNKDTFLTRTLIK